MQMIPRRWAHSEPGEAVLLEEWMQKDAETSAACIGQWEEALAEYIGVPQTAAVNSGRQGLRLILEHLGVGEGDELIVPAYTLGEMLPFVASLGVKLVPADIDPFSLNITPETVAARISERTRAILALHIFGVPCDIQGIRKLAAEHNLKVIEDCAHSLGALVEGRPMGSFGDASFFSFEIIKMVNTYGGGLIASEKAELIAAARDFNEQEPKGHDSLRGKLKSVQMEKRLFKLRLMYPPLYLLASPQWQPLMNRLYRSSQKKRKKGEAYSAAQAKAGLMKLKTLEERVQQRLDRIALMNSLFHEDIRPQHVREGDRASGYFSVVILPVKAASIRKKLLLRGIDAGAGNEIMDNCAALLGYKDCPGIEQVFDHALSLPMYDGISERDCEKVVRVLNSLL
jgi:dTDP-4-amino-4,6-dideoxygalactose transaminase